MTGFVIDASALIAMIRSEPGGGKVAQHLDRGLMSTVNLAEVAGLLVRAGATREQAGQRLKGTLPRLVEASAEHALTAAAILPSTRAAGLSLGDRFCLALALAQQRPVLTADRAWAGLALDGIEIELIR